MVGGHRVGFEEHGHYWGRKGGHHIGHYQRRQFVEVLAMRADGKAPAEIADVLDLQRGTVVDILRDGGMGRKKHE